MWLIKNYKLLILIVLVGAFLRMYALNSNPPSLNWDEVSHGYNAYSILKTGSDEWGNKFPIANFRAYGDYPLPLNLYLTIPFIKFLGLSAFSIRLPHALLGILTIVASYFLVLGIFKRKNLALFVSALVAIEPFYVFTSRFVLQSNLSVFFLIFGLSLFFNREKKKYFLPLSMASLGLTLFSYHTTRIFAPLLIIVGIFIYRKEIKPNLLSVMLLLIFLLPLPIILLNPEARARSNEVFLIDQGAVQRIIELRNTSDLPSTVSKVLFNRPTYFVVNFFKNYIEYFSPNFLFINGGTQYQFSVPNQGLSYLINLPFYYLGFLLLIKGIYKKNKDYIFIFSWLLLALIPASITKEQYAVLRSSAMYPVPQILIGIGAFWVWERMRVIKNGSSKFVLAIYFGLIFLLAGNYLNIYFNDYRKEYSWSWQYGYEEVVNYVKENYDNYPNVVVTKKYGEPHEYFLFFWPWNPDKYENDPELVRFNQSNWYWVDRFDKFYFVNDWQIEDNMTDFVTESGLQMNCKYEKCLLITGANRNFTDWNLLKEVNFLDGSGAFKIYENFK